MRIKKTIFTAASILTLSVCSLLPVTTASASVLGQEISVEQYEDDSITPRQHIKEWIYKIENGSVYKRLYNTTTDTWETDWIYVGPYNP